MGVSQAKSAEGGINSFTRVNRRVSDNAPSAGAAAAGAFAVLRDSVFQPSDFTDAPRLAA
jgi:hypothetical protein